MKKIVLLSAMAALAASASAQYNCNPETSALLEKGTPSKVWVISLADNSMADLTKAGSQIVEVGPNDENRFFWYWDGWVAGPELNPRVGMEEGGYMSLTVTGNAGWSGGGIFIYGPKNADPTQIGPGVDLSAFNDDTHFHFAYCTNGTAPASVGMILLDDGANGSDPAKFSFGTAAFDDNGVSYPLVSGAITDDWQGVDITFGDLKKLWPSFKPANLEAWGGNILSMLSGNIAESNFCLDAVYFYNMGGSDVPDSGVKSVADNASIVITGKTINANGVKGLRVYNANGQLVAATNGTVLGTENLASGLYIVKAGNAVKKFVK